jgi:hypothetical protein
MDPSACRLVHRAPARLVGGSIGRRDNVFSLPVPPLAIMDSAETALPQTHRVAWQIIDNARAIKIREEDGAAGAAMRLIRLLLIPAQV